MGKKKKSRKARRPSVLQMNRERLLRLVAYLQAAILRSRAESVVFRTSTSLTIAKLRTTVRRQRQQLGIDALTGIPNRRNLMQFLGHQIALCRRYDSTVSILFVDIDRFKQFNERHGHESGSAVLRELAQRLPTALRTTDSFGRYGGEEFIIVLVNTPTGGARRVAERLRADVIANQPFSCNGKAVTVTVSIGVAEFRPRDEVTTLIQRASITMLKAKDDGRNCVRWARPPRRRPKPRNKKSSPRRGK